MTYLKTVMGTICLLICLLIGFMFFTFDTSYGLQESLDAFLKGDLNRSKNQLQKLTSSLLPEEKLLYEAYLERELGNLESSNERLILAEKITKSEKILLEITLNQALNGYLKSDQEALFKNVENLKKIYPKEPWTLFFIGLQSFEKGEYEQALNDWIISANKIPLSKWMDKTFSAVFSPSWQEIKICRCQIAQGKYLRQREILMEACHTVSPEHLEEIQLLLGLTFMKEVEDKPSDAATPYYRLASSYFNRVTIHKSKFRNEREAINAQVKRHVLQLIAQRELNDLPFFISLLEHGNAHDERREIASSLIQILNQERSSSYDQCQEFTAVINRLVPVGETRSLLAKQFEDLLSESIRSHNIEEVQLYGNVVIDFSVNPSEKRLKIIYELIQHAENLWNIGQNLEHGTEFLKVSLHLSGPLEQPNIQEAVKKQMVAFFQTAENDPLKLSLLYQLDRDLHLNTFENQSSQYANKSQILFDQKRFKESLLWANLALLLDPQEQHAARVSGLAAYDAADFRGCIKILKRVIMPDSRVIEAIKVSQILTCSPDQRDVLLGQYKETDFTREGRLHLGLGLLALYEPQKALLFLRSIEDPDNEVHAAISCAAYDTNQWNLALHHFYQALSPYHELEGLHAIALHSLLAIGKKELAEEMKQKPLAPPSNDLFPGRFLQFKEARLD